MVPVVGIDFDGMGSNVERRAVVVVRTSVALGKVAGKAELVEDMVVGTAVAMIEVIDHMVIVAEDYARTRCHQDMDYSSVWDMVVGSVVDT